jgi:hypothetical protein
MAKREPDGAGSTETAVLRRSGQTLWLGLLALLLALGALVLAGSNRAAAAGGMSSITIKAFELNPDGSQGAALPNYTFTVNLDNSPSTDNPDPQKRPGFAPIPSHSPTVAVGDQDHATLTLPDNVDVDGNPTYERYLISIRAPDHKLWGKWVELPKDAANGGEVDISLEPTPLPLGKLVIHVFNDNNWTNGAPDEGEAGLAGFKVKLEDQIDGDVSVDYWNNPLCTNYLKDASGNFVDENGNPIPLGDPPVIDSGNPGGECLTGADGNVTITNLGPATYFIYVTAPDGTDWTQTSTVDGAFPLLASVTEGDDGLGMPGETIWEGPGAATAWEFGFVHNSIPFANPGTGSISGTARNWVGWPPFDFLTLGDPVDSPYVALSDSGTDATVYVGRGDSDGNFNIPDVPAGNYNLAIWDEQLNYIMRFVNVSVAAGQAVDLGDQGVSRWFGWLSGYVYQDIGQDAYGNDLGPGTAGNGLRDCSDPNDWTTCEPGITNFDMDQRWRDGSIKEDTKTKGETDPNGPGYYEYPQAEGGALGKFIIGEVGFTRLGTEPGASVHDELNPSNVTHVCASPAGAPANACDVSEGGGLLTNQLLSEGHRAWVDWGKRPYLDGATNHLASPISDMDTSITLDSSDGFPASDGWQLTIGSETMLVTGGSGSTTLAVERGYDGSTAAAHDAGADVVYEGEPGQIVGITYFATTRNEFYGDTATNESYEAAIPDVEVRLESPDGTVLNDYITDHWQHPSANTDSQTCDVTDAFGQDLSGLLNPLIGPNCLETPLTGQETKDGAFDGGYAFADYCPEGAPTNGFDTDLFLSSGESKCNDGSDPVALKPGQYVTHFFPPTSQDPNDQRPCNPDNAFGYKSVSGAMGDAGPKGCLYRPEREEDVNVDLGAQFTPAIPAPPCVGDDHTIDATGAMGGEPLTARSPYSPDSPQFNGITNVPLCDKKFIDLKTKQNANADFFLMTNQPNGIDVEEPGRVVGSVFDDIYFDRDVQSIWYGEPRPLGNIPVGIYDYKFRLIRTVWTDENGAYETMLPSTQTFNCPIPQGPCPGMYTVVVDDPGHVVKVDGTVSTVAGTNTVTGAGTHFLDQVKVGNQISVRVGNGPAETKTVTAVNSDTSLTVATNWVSTMNGATLSVLGNKGYNPNYLTANTSFDVWPGQTDQLDTPIDPVSGTGCELATGTPELLQVNRSAGAAQDNLPAGYQAADGPFVRGGSFTNDTWTLSRGATAPTGGSFRLTVNGQQTGVLAFNANAATVQTALAGLSTVGAGNVAVTGGALTSTTPFTITFIGALAGTARTVTVQNSLTPSPAVTLTLTHTVTGSFATGYFDNTPASRRIRIQGVNFGTAAGTITLTDLQGRAGSSRTFTGLASAAQLANLQIGGIVSWADREIVLQVPAPKAATSFAPTAPFFPGQYQLMIQDAAAAGGLSTVTGITLHVLGTVGANAYNPRVRSAAAPGSASGADNGHELQTAIDNANAGDLLILSAGVYREGVIVWKPLKLQGLGPGGTVGVVEPGGPPLEDPRANIQGTGIDGGFFRDLNAPTASGGPGYWDAKLASLTYVGQHDYVSKGADITVLAQTTTAYNGTGPNAARIDGLAIQNGQGSFGAGGLEGHAYGNNLQVTNDVFDADRGEIGGAIDLGTPYHGDQNNKNVRIQYTRVMGSGGITRGGAITLFNGSDNYEIANSTICSDFSNEYGAGISHWGKSPGGSIHDNKIYYNDAVDSGGGLSISEETPQPAGSIPFTDARRGSGAVDVRRNVIEANMSGDDGGGIFVQDGLTARISIVGNMIVNNGAADLGGAIMLDDSSNVALVNNTVANNAATASSEGTDGQQHAGGLTAEANDPAFTAAFGLTEDFSNPATILNNIFWDNEACTLDKSQVPPALQGCNGEVNDPNATYLDFEVHGTSGAGSGPTACVPPSPGDGCRRFSNAKYNLFTNGTIREPDVNFPATEPFAAFPNVGFPTVVAGQGNQVGVDPQFVAPFGTAFAVGPSRLDPQVAAVTIVTADPPVGIQGDYHLQTALALNQISGAVDRGVRCSTYGVPPPALQLSCPAGAIEAPLTDIDGQGRPQLRTLRLRTLWDRGADEVPIGG